LSRRFDVDNLKDPTVVESFQARIGGYFEPQLAYVDSTALEVPGVQS